MGVMRESAGWTAPPLSAMGRPRYLPDAEMGGHTPTKRRGKGGRGNGYITRGGNICVILEGGGGGYSATTLKGE